MAAFEYRQAEEIRDVLERHEVRHIFISKSGAMILGFPDTTQVEQGCGELSEGSGVVAEIEGVLGVLAEAERRS